jgi:hypothetical protein
VPEPDWKDRDVPLLFAVWWGAFLVGNWLGNLALRLTTTGGEDVQAVQQQTQAFLALDAVDAVAGVLSILVVRRATGRQHARAAQLADPASAAQLVERGTMPL